MYYWWEVVFLMQRLIIVGFVQWIPEPSQRILVGVMIALLYLCALMAAKPYKRADLGRLAFWSQLATFLCLFASLYIHQLNKLTVYSFAEPEAAIDVIGFSSIDSLATTIIIITLAFLCCFFVFAIHQIYHAHDVGILRMSLSMYPPELSLSQGMRFHMFLSHIWSSGQDQVANIKRMLQLTLPGCRIFLE